MTYRVRWQLVGRSGQLLDSGCVGEGFCAYGDAVAAVVEFLRSYPEVCRCPAESYWLSRFRRGSQRMLSVIPSFGSAWDADHGRQIPCCRKRRAAA